MVLVVWVWKKYPASKESPSFNMTMWIALADIPTRVSSIFTDPYTFPDGYPNNPALLRFIYVIIYLGSYWFIYSTCMITLDLQLVFFHRLPRQARIRRWYPLLSFLMTIVLTLPYMWLPNFRFMEDEATNAASGSPAAWFFMVWTEFWMHAGIIYSIIVVAAVCIKMLVARSRLRRLGGIASKNGISRSLICNAGLIIAYPTVLFIVYVPYVFHAWLIGSSTGTFFICWSVASFALFAAQGIFSFAIVLFHPVMLALYRQRNFGLRPLWSRLSHPFKGSADKIYHSSGTPLYSQFSTTRNLSSENPIVDIQTHPPQIKTMDMGPGVASLFNGSLGDDNIQTATDRQNLGELDEVAVIGVGNSELDQSPLETHCLYHESTLL